MKLSSGYIIVGAYADKIRRTLFAQLKDHIKNKEIDPKMVAKASGELNKLLYEILVNKLKLDKGDVVRVMVEYELVDGEVLWKLDTLKVEAFKRMPEEEIKPVVEDAISRMEELEEIEEMKFEIEKAGETDLGDIVYFVKADGEFAGVLMLTPLNGEGLVRGALIKPNPVVIEKMKIDTGEDLKQVLVEVVEQKGREIDEGTAEKIVNEIKELIVK
ncbi:hypothetical protein CFE53_00340 [Methanofervidicoccus sp. A16]|uniref:DUF2258 domain-containing protein n=1 Tax=Methanofervidicoccus sp. A16 TaxID=2607662 RepID=UPI00118D319D|nr:DUF2258 domain-containing protein [Methanofervidicoccus sp. A16]AXI24701.1 hypothetical protein CFE53_00340 [Methanofervidicoccus sp. A16]MBW9220109.1 DUF2258 domain-containing protein [Methanothermococcus sp. SCGC AD-155-N22]